MSDNRIFNVNGGGQEFLRDVLTLAFRQSGGNTVAVGYYVSTQHGLVLLWSLHSVDGAIPLPSEADASLAADLCWNWLRSSAAKNVVTEGWDSDLDHDGDNTQGWRVYCEDWGHVDGKWQAICAVKPAHLWHGK